MLLEHAIAGFWKRSLAFIIDIILVGIIGFCIVLLLGDFYYRHPVLLSLLGYLLTLPYFMIGDSYILQGQTLGKKLLNINVATADQKFLSLKQAFIRSSILLLVFCFNTLHFYIENEILRLSIQTFLAVLAATFGYLYIFNRHTRQTLHDLLVKSYVFDQKSPAAEVVKIWKYHYLFLVIFIGLNITGIVVPYQESRVDPVAIKVNQLFAHSKDILQIKTGKYSSKGTPIHTLQFIVPNPDLVNSSEFEQYVHSTLQTQMPELFTGQQRVEMQFFSGAQFGIYYQYFSKWVKPEEI